MKKTIMETLSDANHNINNNGGHGIMIAREQLDNAVTLLEKGHDLSDEVEPLLLKNSAEI